MYHWMLPGKDWQRVMIRAGKGHLLDDFRANVKHRLGHVLALDEYLTLSPCAGRVTLRVDHDDVLWGCRYLHEDLRVVYLHDLGVQPPAGPWPWEVVPDDEQVEREVTSAIRSQWMREQHQDVDRPRPLPTWATTVMDDYRQHSRRRWHGVDQVTMGLSSLGYRPPAGPEAAAVLRRRVDLLLYELESEGGAPEHLRSLAEWLGHYHAKGQPPHLVVDGHVVAEHMAGVPR